MSRSFVEVNNGTTNYCQLMPMRGGAAIAIELVHTAKTDVSGRFKANYVVRRGRDLSY